MILLSKYKYKYYNNNIIVIIIVFNFYSNLSTLYTFYSINRLRPVDPPNMGSSI